MRFRDIAVTAFAALVTVWLGLYGNAVVQRMLYHSQAINREDARSVTATLLPTGQWVEFHILSDATTVRLLTNAALQSMDAPDHDLTNPRQGWRYTVQYELLDSQRNVVDAADYHFRTQVRQRLDAHTGKLIYPIFLAKNGLVSAQTRPMQLAIDHFRQRPVILRVRLKSVDVRIREVVARSLSRIERADYNKRYTWNRLSKQRREMICKYTVYQPELLTFAERTNLLKWRWAQTPALSDSETRSLYFIGSSDDHEVREEQLPQGLFTDPNWLATVPIPEGKGRVRLQFTAVDRPPSRPPLVDVRWFGVGATNRRHVRHQLAAPTSNLTMDLDGGLIQIQSPVRLVARVYWRPPAATANGDVEELEITPIPILAKGFVVDDQPVEYSIGHIADDRTPLRVSLRYPFGPNFGNLKIESTGDISAGSLGDVSASWEFLDADANLVDSGKLTFTPVVSRYDNVELAAGTEWLSEPEKYYFFVPSKVKRLRITSPDCRLLVQAAVRPASLKRTTQVPEDYHAFGRSTSLHRCWFGLNPPNDHDLVQANRTIIIRSQTRPPEDNEDILAGNYQWRRYLPRGQWIGRQILVPQAAEINVREQSAAAMFFELHRSQDYEFAALGGSAQPLPAKLIVIGNDTPGSVRLNVNGQQLFNRNIHSARAEIDLNDVEIPASGTISVTSDVPARYFFSGRRIDQAERFLKRTAQRLGKQPLTFRYEKESRDEELLTIQVYRRGTDQARYRLQVKIDPIHRSIAARQHPTRSWTALDRTYDLRPHVEQSSLLLGQDSHVDAGYRCFVRLGEELAPGTYEIRIDREHDDAEGYVLMYQTLPNQASQRKIRVNSLQSKKKWGLKISSSGS